jgi:hypothetical protein
MPPVHLRPRSIPELVDAAVPLLRRHYLLLVTASAVLMLPALVLEVALPPELVGIAKIASNLLFALLDAATITIVSDAYLGNTPDLSSTLRAVGMRSGSLIGASILRGLIIVLGLVLLIVPGVVFFAWSFAMPMVIMIEGHDAGSAFTRSRELVRGNVWRVLLTILLAFVIVFVLGVAGGAALGALGSAIGLPSRTVTLLGELSIICFYPIGSVVGTLLYYDLRIRNEGFDLEVMARELDPSSSSSSLGAGVPAT